MCWRCSRWNSWVNSMTVRGIQLSISLSDLRLGLLLFFLPSRLYDFLSVSKCAQDLFKDFFVVVFFFLGGGVRFRFQWRNVDTAFETQRLPSTSEICQRGTRRLDVVLLIASVLNKTAIVDLKLHHVRAKFSIRMQCLVYSSRLRVHLLHHEFLPRSMLTPSCLERCILLM